MEGDESAGRVPRELREKLKKARGAKALLQDLEEEVRRFVAAWEAQQREMRTAELEVTEDSEDEEIVFVGRNGAVSHATDAGLKKELRVFGGLIDDHAASFR